MRCIRNNVKLSQKIVQLACISSGVSTIIMLLCLSFSERLIASFVLALLLPFSSIISSYYLANNRDDIRSKNRMCIATTVFMCSLILNIKQPIWPSEVVDICWGSQIGFVLSMISLFNVWACDFISKIVLAKIRRFPTKTECQNCGYDIQHIIGDQYPECGYNVKVQKELM